MTLESDRYLLTLYFWFRLFGLPGSVISIKPASRAGLR